MIPKNLRRLLVASAVLHGVLFLVVALAGSLSARAKAPAPANFIPTKLVRLGERRAKDLLPRAERQPPPPPKPDVSLTPPSRDAPITTATPEPAQPSALERAKSLANVSRALDRLKKTADNAERPDGDPSGVEEGEVSDLSRAIVGNKYATEIYKCMKTNWEIEGINREKVAGREASVVVHVQADGKLFGTKVLTKSGLPAFDQAVERAVVKCGRVSKPPDMLRDNLAADGIEIVFKP